jgi:exopolyphosphatase/guanosine-5'-triphosphate,3'-diphosphate pyrophosphatase
VQNILLHDEKIIVNQLARKPRGLLGVACRCFQGVPAVIITHPLFEGKRIFPTNWWLTCPWLNKAISYLEGHGGVERVDQEISLEAIHHHYALRRQALVPWPGRWELFLRSPSLYQIMVESGVGGIIPPGGVKCLHTHYADYLVEGQNPIGEWVHDQLSKELIGRYATSCRVCEQPTLCPSDGLIVSSPSAQLLPETHGTIVAAIDVGTNSLRLLIGQGDKDNWVSLRRELWNVRLGEGLTKTGVICSQALARTKDTLEKVKGIIGQYPISRIKAVATSAVREARNGQVIINLFQEAGINLEVISGTREGELSWQGAFGHRREEGLAIVDIGGGSTEIAFQDQSLSIPIGVVKVTEEGTSPEGIRSQMLKSLHDLPTITELCAVGGTGTTLAAIDLSLVDYHPDLVQDHILTRERLNQLGQFLEALPLEWKTRLPGLPPERADVISAGALILQVVLDTLNLPQVVISDRDLLTALVNDSI